MTVSTTATRISYSGSGTTGPFAYNFKIFADGDLTVVKTVDATGVSTTLTLTTDYTVSGAGDDAGGSVTTVAAVASGETLLIYLDLDISQSTDFVNNDGFDADVLEDAIDRNTLIAKQINDSKIDFAITAPSSDSSPSMELPSATDRASKQLGFDANGDVSVNVSTAGTLLDEDDFASDSDTQGVTQQSAKAYITTQVSTALEFNSGTTMVFHQAAAPTGWTQVDLVGDDTDTTGYALRVVNDGTETWVDSSGESTSGVLVSNISHTHTAAAHTHGAGTLTSPTHTHLIDTGLEVKDAGGGGTGDFAVDGSDIQTGNPSSTTITGSTASDGDDATTAPTSTLALKYVDITIADKD